MLNPETAERLAAIENVARLEEHTLAGQIRHWIAAGLQQSE